MPKPIFVCFAIPSLFASANAPAKENFDQKLIDLVK
jgi:hypothetical protein